MITRANRKILYAVSRDDTPLGHAISGPLHTYGSWKECGALDVRGVVTNGHHDQKNPRETVPAAILPIGIYPRGSLQENQNTGRTERDSETLIEIYI